MKRFGKDCLTALPRQANAMLTFGMGKSIKTACKTPEDREILHRRLKCVTKIHDIMNEKAADMTQAFIDVLQLDVKDRLPGVCCTFFQFKANMTESAGKRCPKEDVDFFNFFQDGFSGDTVDLLCSGLSHGSEKCIQTLNKISRDENKTRTEFTFFIPPLLLVLDSL